MTTTSNSYTDLNIHQRINAKNNAPILYRSYGFGSLLAVIKNKPSGFFNPHRLMIGSKEFKIKTFTK